MRYTVSAEEGVHLGESDTTAATLQNVLTILTTRQGSIPMYRDFGLPQRFLDKPVNMAAPIALVEVKEAVEAFEPRAEVISVTFTQDGRGQLIPTVEVDIRE